MTNRFITFISLFACSALFAVESATVIITTKDGKMETRVVRAQKIDACTNRIVVPASSIPENFEYVDVLADNAVAKKGERGFWIFARGEMGTFKLDNDRYENKRNQMPIFGMQTPRETFVAIIKGLQLENWLVAEVNNGIYKVYPRWSANFIGFKPYEDIIIDFVTLTGDDANYGGMGRTYRKYQLDRGMVKPFRERMKNNLALQQIATAMPHRIEPHGQIPGKGNNATVFTSATVPPMKPILTFENSKNFVRAFKDAGMTDVHFCDAGWQSYGYGGACPQIFPIDESLGGEAGLRDYIKYTQSLGYQICPNANHTDAFTCSYMWSPEYVAKRQDGNLYKVVRKTDGNCWMDLYYICVKHCWELFIKAQMDQTRALGFRGAYYIDVFSAIQPIPCFDKNHPANRKEQAQAQNTVLAYAKELFGGAASECGFDHCIQNLDYVNYLGRYMLYGEGVEKYKNGNPRVYNTMIDRIAPLWEIVYHGIVLSNPDKFTQAYLAKGSTARLRLIEFGGRPIRYNWNYSPKVIAEYKEMYDMFQPLKHLQLEFMEENRELAPKVFLTRYSDGSETVVNYSEEPFAYKGATVPARDYGLFKPKN